MLRLISLFLLVVTARAEIPWDMARLSAAPKAEWGERKELVQDVWYESEPFEGKPTRVFAYVGKPEGAGPFPAVVLVHGGGGEAFRDWADHWAKRGYVSIAMDTAGKGPKKAANPDGGPRQDDGVKFRTDAAGGDMWTYHAVAAAIRGHSLLLSLPEVDKSKTALTGISWGGYLTCIIAGVDHRFKAAVPVYGCGFLHENSVWKPTHLDKMTPAAREKWVAQWDPSSHLSRVECPILFFNGTNDFAYPLDSYRKCYRLVRPELRNVSIVVELKHGHFWNFPEPDLFIDSVLLGKEPLAKLGGMEVKDGAASATLKISGEPQELALCYTTDVGAWQKRKWRKLPAVMKDGRVTAALPAEKPLTFYLSAKDSRGATVSTEHEEIAAE
jgi:dienelactone hydrolase